MACRRMRKYFQKTCLTKDWYLENIKVSYNATNKQL